MALLEIKVNGREHRLEVEPTASLLTVLREQLHITGPKPGCETGDCGACNVLVDGELRRGCLTNALSVSGSEITTVEGLGAGGDLHPVQKRFYENYASQCGYCTPGMVMAAKELLDHNAQPSDDQIKLALSGNLCRCASYPNIIKAIKAAAEDVAGKGGGK